MESVNECKRKQSIMRWIVGEPEPEPEREREIEIICFKNEWTRLKEERRKREEKSEKLSVYFERWTRQLNTHTAQLDFQFFMTHFLRIFIKTNCHIEFSVIISSLLFFFLLFYALFSIPSSRRDPTMFRLETIYFS